MSTLGKDLEKLSGDVVADFKLVVSDVEALLSATANQGNSKLDAVRAKAEESLKAAKVRLADAQAAVVEKTCEAAKATDTYVHESPWQAVGVAAAVGVVIGWLIRGR